MMNEGRLEEWGIPLRGGSMSWTGMECSFKVERKDMLSKVLERVSVSVVASLLGNMEGRSSLRAFENKRYIRIPCKRASLSIATLLENLKGNRLP